MSRNRFSQYLPDGLVRDVDNAKVAGVCAGLAGYFGVQAKFVRWFLIIASVCGFFMVCLVVYAVLAVMMPQAPAGFAYGGFDKADPNPVNTNTNLREHFTKLDRRLANMEAWVTSDDYRLRQRFRDL